MSTTAMPKSDRAAPFDFARRFIQSFKQRAQQSIAASATQSPVVTAFAAVPQGDFILPRWRLSGYQVAGLFGGLRMSPGLTVIVPAWNEEKRLTTTVVEAATAARRHLRAFEIIIVNDGSTDRTAAVADSLAARFPFVSVVHHTENLGVGAAYHTGLSLARYRYLTLVPGDHAFHASGLHALFALVG